MTKKIINLHELQRKFVAAYFDETGVQLPNEYPVELTPAWRSYCKRNWNAFEQARERRMAQLAFLGMAETHAIDYYLDNERITPL